MRTHHLAAALAASLCLVACGGKGGKDSGIPGVPTATPPTTPTPTVPPPTTPPSAFAPLEIAQLELAQTHVMPEGGLRWTLTNAKEELHAIGGREALALIKLAKGDAVNPRVEGWRDGVQLGTAALSATLPPTEAAGPAYANGVYAATLPKAWLAPGLKLRVRADNYSVGAFREPLVGADSPALLRVLPFYLFGATDTNSIPLADTAVPDAATVDELYAKWPVASLVAQNHPAKRVVWPTVVIGPKDGKPAYVIHNTNEEHAGFQIMSTVLGTIGGLLHANGESSGPVQYYAPLLMFDAAGVYKFPGGGLGSLGGDIGVGDHTYTVAFVHEQGHAMGLPHQGEAYDQAKYPYPRGSLSGSAWGYDSIRKEFQAPFMPPTSENYAKCRTNDNRLIDAHDRCIKQDPMQGGAGDGAKNYRFSIFSDYSVGIMQRHFEGVTRVENGARVYGGGSIIADAAFPGGYKRWDSLDRRWVNVEATTSDYGLYGIDDNRPTKRDVPVHAIVISYSLAGTPNVSQIYPVLSFRGNLVRTIDPADAAQRASIAPNGAYNWYCHGSGCDYSLRVTYTNGNVRTILLQGGFRPWFDPTTAPKPEATDPNHERSFRTWVINVPGEVAIQKVELLDTPRAWEGLPANPVVLAGRQGMGMAGTKAAGVGADAIEGECVELATVAAPRSAMPAPRCPGNHPGAANVPQAGAFDMRDTLQRLLRN
ncbi:M66 family metalloprotease [Lysobacter sp. CA196]|uniref:M66 family metalloprotease n=1 Tax=Lysobacter sp. CA196 TaxID=3455606 RepID=UPI003F8D8797